jgi:hypothetical protein
MHARRQGKARQHLRSRYVFRCRKARKTCTTCPFPGALVGDCFCIKEDGRDDGIRADVPIYSLNVMHTRCSAAVDDQDYSRTPEPGGSVAPCSTQRTASACLTWLQAAEAPPVSVISWPKLHRAIPHATKVILTYARKTYDCVVQQDNDVSTQLGPNGNAYPC